jgi:hypothetical protein
LTYTPRPKPSFVDDLERVRRSGKPRWRDAEGCLYEYDGEHGGEFEKYDKNGRHIGVADVKTGAIIKPAVRGRRIDV